MWPPRWPNVWLRPRTKNTELQMCGMNPSGQHSSSYRCICNDSESCRIGIAEKAIREMSRWGHSLHGLTRKLERLHAGKFRSRFNGILTDKGRERFKADFEANLEVDLETNFWSRCRCSFGGRFRGRFKREFRSRLGGRFQSHLQTGLEADLEARLQLKTNFEASLGASLKADLEANLETKLETDLQGALEADGWGFEKQIWK